jgi:hypothetical protein
VGIDVEAGIRAVVAAVAVDHVNVGRASLRVVVLGLHGVQEFVDDLTGVVPAACFAAMAASVAPAQASAAAIGAPAFTSRSAAGGERDARRLGAIEEDPGPYVERQHAKELFAEVVATGSVQCEGTADPLRVHQGVGPRLGPEG